MTKTRNHRYITTIDNHTILKSGCIRIKESDPQKEIYIHDWTIIKEKLNYYLLFRSEDFYNDKIFVS